MFGAKYSRGKFWIWSIILMILNIPLQIMERISKAPNVNIEEVDTGTMLLIFLILILPSIIWLNTLANRIRDYGSNPWLSLWALIPLVNLGMGFYYGIVQYKRSNEAPSGAQYKTSSETPFRAQPQNQSDQRSQSTTKNQDILEKMKNMK